MTRFTPLPSGSDAKSLRTAALSRFTAIALTSGKSLLYRSATTVTRCGILNSRSTSSAKDVTCSRST